MVHPRSTRKNKSTWRAVRMPHQDIERTLHQRYSLRLHGLCIGSFTLLLMWATAHLQLRLGVESLALRYLVTLSVGYLGYLLVLRVWAAQLLRRRTAQDSGFDVDLPDIDWPSGGPSGSGGACRCPAPAGAISAAAVPRAILPRAWAGPPMAARWATWQAVHWKPSAVPTRAPLSWCPSWRSS